VTTDQKLADLKQALAWAQLAGWQARGKDQRELMRKVETLKRQIALIEKNRGNENVTEQQSGR
jgi:hypothetical protein